MKFNQIRESMTTILPWTRPDADEYTFYYEYGLSQDIIEVSFDEYKFLEDALEISFSVNRSYFPAWKNESQIPMTTLFATVLDIIKDHADNTRQDIYVIIPTSRKLRSLYEKMIKRFLPRGWGVGVEDDAKRIVLYRKA